MSTHRGKAAFPPDSRSLGGAYLTQRDTENFIKRVEEAGPTVAQLVAARRRPHSVSMAERLSINRARRRAAVDSTAVNHVNNIYHMHRRIEESYSATERKKNLSDPSIYPVYQKRTNNFTQSLLPTTTLPWQQPHTQVTSSGYGATGYATSRTRPLSAPTSRIDKGDGYTGLSVTKSHLDTYPASRYAETMRLADHTIYKKAIMQEVVDNRMYKEQDLKRLFRTYLKLAPLADKETVEQVIAELKDELDVR